MKKDAARRELGELAMPDTLLDHAAGNRVTLGSEGYLARQSQPEPSDALTDGQDGDKQQYPKELSSADGAAETAAPESPTLQKQGPQASAPACTDSQEFDVSDCDCDTLRDDANSRGRARTADLGVMNPTL